MDPLSLTASIVALLQLMGTAISYVNDVKGATKDRAKVAIEAATTYGLFTLLMYRVEEANSADP